MTWKTFAEWLFKVFLLPFIPKLWNKFTSWIDEKWENWKHRRKTDKARDKMEDAKNAKEVDDAFDDTLDDI